MRWAQRPNPSARAACTAAWYGSAPPAAKPTETRLAALRTTAIGCQIFALKVMTHPPARVHQVNQRMPTTCGGLIVSVWDCPRLDGADSGTPRCHAVDHQHGERGNVQEVETHG